MSLASGWRALWRRRGPPAPRAVNPPGEAERLLRRLDFTVIRPLDGLRQGDHRNSAYGAGLDLAELREYQPGDDVRALDWNVTARMGTAYVRRYHEDRDVTAWLVLDLSASTDFGSGLQTKRELILDVAGTLARLLTGRGDRVGALLYTGSPAARGSDGPARREAPPSAAGRRARMWDRGRGAERERLPAELVAAGGGRVHTLQLLQRALDATRRAHAGRHDPRGTSQASQASNSRQPAGTLATDLEALLAQAFQTARQRSLVFVISDYLQTASHLLTPSRSALEQGQTGAEEAWARALGTLARRHEVVGVCVRDAREMALPDAGVVTFEDAETGEQIVIDTSQPSVREAYVAQAAARAAAMQQLFARHQAALWTVTTAEPLVPALVRFLEQRRRTLVGVQRLVGRAL